jgi:hypothetical protein
MGSCMSVCLHIFLQQWDWRSHCCKTLVQELPKVIVQSCATMVWNHISARMTKYARVTMDNISTTVTYILWHEEHLWNVSILQRVHLSSFFLYLLHRLTWLDPFSDPCNSNKVWSFYWVFVHFFCQYYFILFWFFLTTFFIHRSGIARSTWSNRIGVSPLLPEDEEIWWFFRVLRFWRLFKKQTVGKVQNKESSKKCHHQRHSEKSIFLSLLLQFSIMGRFCYATSQMCIFAFLW